MMNKIFIFLSILFLFISSTFAETSSYRINNQTIAFTAFTQKHITISSNCVNKNNLKKCEASLALQEANLGRLPKDNFGRNPGALICSEQLKGKVVWASDKNGNERTFCQFKDNSYVGSGTLSYYGHKNAEFLKR